MKRIFSAAALMLLLMVLTTSPAHAYLDPASGSMILQVIVAALAGVAITLKAFWHRIRGLFRGRRSGEGAQVEDKP